MVKLMIIEDEIELANNIASTLQKKLKNTDIYLVHTLNDSFNILKKVKPDIVIIDINLPDGRGTDFHKVYKEIYPDGVAIFLTAIDSDIEKLVAFQLGAEDYITKPFNFQELIAKVNNWINRIQKNKKNYIHIFSNYYLDNLSGGIFEYKEDFYHLIENLSYKESKLFELLIKNFGKTIDYELIKQEIDINLDELPIVIYHLRRKISKLKSLKIVTIKGGKIKILNEYSY